MNSPVKTVSDFAAVARAGTWFGGLPAALQHGLLDGAVVRELAVGERLFGRGDPFDGLYCVAAGAVRVTSIDEAGREALLVIVEPPYWLGEISLFDGLPRTHDAWAHAATTLLHVPQPALEALLAATPAWWREFGLLLTQKLRLAFVALEELARLPAPERVARRLLAIAEGYGDARVARREIRVPQDQLALMLSLSRQTVNQILRQLETSGAVRLARGGIEIVDVAALRRHANSV